MDDVISRQETVAALMETFKRNTTTAIRAKLTVEALPPAQPQRTGRWRHYGGYLTCSECKTEYYDDIMEYCGDDVPRFCPHCGARMEGEDNERA